MAGLIDVLLIIGVLAFLAQALLKLISDESTTIDAPAWKWKNVLLIVAGACLFILLGLTSLWGFLQQQESSGLIPGITLVLAGIAVIWSGVHELLQFTSSRKWINYLLLIIGVLFILWQGHALWQFYQGNGHIISVENLVLLVVGLFVTIQGIQRVKADNSALQYGSLRAKQPEEPA